MLIMNLLIRPGRPDYSNLNAFGQSLFQPIYRIIKTEFEQKKPMNIINQVVCRRDEITQKKVDPTTLMEEVG
jgi:hypothetical protein